MSKGIKRKREKSVISMTDNPDKLITNIFANRTLNTVKSGVLTISAYSNFYPVCYKEGNEIKGLDVDIMKLFCELSGLKLHLIEEKHFSDIWLKPIEGKSDTSIGGIGITPSRTTNDTEWTIPYFYVYRTLIYNKNNPLTGLKDVTGIVSGTKGSTGFIDAQIKLKN
mgnify:FL=1